MKHIESSIQINCVKWFKLQYPHILIAAIPNGGARSPITGAILKAEGVLAGMPDLFIAIAHGCYHGLFIEMKKDSKSKPKKNQSEVHENLKSELYRVSICCSFDEFKNIVTNYLEIGV
jgi:hypothetical protein